jgi:hypothetical protein
MDIALSIRILSWFQHNEPLRMYTSRYWHLKTCSRIHQVRRLNDVREDEVASSASASPAEHRHFEAPAWSAGVCTRCRQLRHMHYSYLILWSQEEAPVGVGRVRGRLGGWKRNKPVSPDTRCIAASPHCRLTLYCTRDVHRGRWVHRHSWYPCMDMLYSSVCSSFGKKRLLHCMMGLACFF